MFPSISRLLLRWRGDKVYSQTGWGAMTGFSSGSATGGINCGSMHLTIHGKAFDRESV